MAEQRGQEESGQMDLSGIQPNLNEISPANYVLVIKEINAQETGEYVYISDGPPLEVHSIEDLEKFRVEFVDLSISKLKQEVVGLETTKNDLQECLKDAVDRLRNLEKEKNGLKIHQEKLEEELNETRFSEEKFRNKLLDAENNMFNLIRQHDERIMTIESDRLAFLNLVNSRIQQQGQEAREQQTKDQEEILKSKSELTAASLEIGRLNKILQQERGTALNCILKRLGVTSEDILYIINIFYEVSSRASGNVSSNLHDPRLLRTSPTNIPLNN